MAGYTLEQAQQQLQLWLDADATVATRQSYSVGGRTLTSANASEITSKIQFWSGEVEKLTMQHNTKGTNRIKRFVPRDL